MERTIRVEGISTTTTGRAGSWAVRLDALSFALLGIVPLGMALVNRSAQPLLVGALASALAARYRAGELGACRRRVVALLASAVGLGALAFLVFAAVSIGWSHHPKTSLSAYGELVASAGAALLLHAALARTLPGWVVKLAVVSAALGCLLIVGELANGMQFRAGLGIRNYTFIFKRSVTAMMILFWPVAACLWVTGRRPIALAAGLLLLVATYAAHSSATALGLAAGLAALGVAAVSPRAASRVVAAGLAAAFLVAPVLGDLSERLLPAHVVERLHFAHAEDRIDIWRSFGEVVRRRPVGGAGFGTSPVMAQEPVAAEVPPERRVLLGAWHPHNGYLQVWAETGTIGALLFGLTLLAATLALGRAGGVRAVAGSAVLASAAAVMLVGHGLWQGWWSAVLGIAAIWIARLPGQADR